MDTTEEYCKMCDCPEIQGLWIPEEGDYHIINGHDVIEILPSMLFHDRSISQTQESSIWLPRQDQLQDMVKNIFEANVDGKYYWHKLLITMFKDLHEIKIDWSMSMEQLWLAFVMFKLHKKKWNGEAWEK